MISVVAIVPYTSFVIDHDSNPALCALDGVENYLESHSMDSFLLRALVAAKRARARRIFVLDPKATGLGNLLAHSPWRDRSETVSMSAGQHNRAIEAMIKRRNICPFMLTLAVQPAPPGQPKIKITGRYQELFVGEHNGSKTSQQRFNPALSLP